MKLKVIAPAEIKYSIWIELSIYHASVTFPKCEFLDHNLMSLFYVNIKELF